MSQFGKGFSAGNAMGSPSMVGKGFTGAGQQSFGKGSMPGLGSFQPLGSPPRENYGEESFFKSMMNGLFGEDDSFVNYGSMPILHPRPETRLVAFARAGSTELPVANYGGIQQGERVFIDRGSPMEEVAEVVSASPFCIKQPLKYDHAPGTTIATDELQDAGLGVRQNPPGFELMSDSQLKEMVESKRMQIQTLEQEVQSMDGPMGHEERLSVLERKLAGVRPGQHLPLYTPVLGKIAKIVRDSHEIEHQSQFEEIKNDKYYADVKPWEYLHAEDLVLGRSLMPLDRQFIAKEKLKQELESNRHPTINRFHYAGNVAKPAENIDCVFVKEEGVLKRSPLYPAPYRNEFWLNLDGHTRHDAEHFRRSQDLLMEDPVSQRIMRKDAGGTREDTQAVDWLGLKKRGEPVDEPRPPELGFTLPTWMY